MGEKKKFASSYISELSSGYDAKGVDGPQLGKAETEEVSSQNWGKDKRDAIGRAASLMKRKRLARKLRRIAREIEAMEQAELDEGYEDGIEEAQVDLAQQINDKATGKSPKDMDAVKASVEDDMPEPVDGLVDEDVEMADDEDAEMNADNDADDIGGDSDPVDEDDDEDDEDDDEDDNFIEASHPIDHDSNKDDPEAFMDAQTGDDEWIDIGPGSFDDKRNEIGKASRKK